VKSAPARNRGFSLIELLITLAILAIVTSLGVAGYRQYVQRAARVDATSALLRVAAAQERFYTQNGQYAGDEELTLAPPAGLGITGTERGYYALAIDSADAELASGFTASAMVDPGSNQGDDEDCWIFSINERGQRSARDRDDAENTDRCWR
jgi:type IV pilus assembly protein PilE